MEKNPKNAKEQVYPHEKSLCPDPPYHERLEAGFETVITVN